MAIKSVHISTRVWNLLVQVLILIVVGILVGSMISFFSPQATLTMGYGARIEFWILLCLIGGAGMFLCDLTLMFLQLNLVGWRKVILQSICGTISVLIPLYALYDAAEIPRPSTTVLFVWIVMVLILAGATIAGSKLITTSAKNDIEEATEKPHASRPARILSRLPIPLQSSELYALSAEDHYVRVHTSKGENIILMRFSDAISETGDVEGLQVHRSWWVAQAAIEHIKAKDRNAEITLKNKLKVPVSRNALKRVRNKGWL